jgi:uncharacterized membrane protein
MQSRARLFGHPVHQILVVFPLGLLATSFVFDVVHYATGESDWSLVSFWMITSGIIGGVVAAGFGLVDWLAIPRGTRAYRVGIVHGLGNLVVMALFAISWALRYQTIDVPLAALVFAAAGVGLSLITGWLGGELVVRLGIGVDQVDDLDAPSSLSREYPRERSHHYG